MQNVSALVLIYDIRGFTAASKRMGTANLGAFATAAHRAILDCFAAVPPTFVKNLGDGHLLLWETGPVPDPDLVSQVVAGADRARTAFAAFVAGQGAGGASLPRRVGIGVAVGEVSRSDDYYGVALNLAARLQGLARPEGLAVDRTVFETVSARDVAWRSEFQRARVRLKGLGSTLVWVKRPFSWARLLGRAGRVAAAVSVPLAYAALADAGLRVPGGVEIRSFLDRHEASVLRPAPGEGEIRAAAQDLRRRLAQALLAARTPEGWVRSDLRGASDEALDVWPSSQSITALLHVPGLSVDDLRPLLGGLSIPFAHGRYVVAAGKPLGWIAHPTLDYTEVEPALWTVAALACALGRPGLVPDADRPLFLDRLARAQAAADTYHPFEDGGWNVFPFQQDPRLHSPYSTALAFLALLETREAGLPWDGSVERRDALLAATQRYVVSRFQDSPPLPGWRRTHVDLDPVSPGLTLETYSLLLRAEALTGLEVPPAVLAAIPRQLESLETAGMEERADAGEYTLHVFRPGEPETAADGRPNVATRSESIDFLWHPWAVDTAVRWLDRARRLGAPTEERVRVRRALGHLVIDLREDVLAAAVHAWSFIAAETVYGLAGIPPP